MSWSGGLGRSPASTVYVPATFPTVDRRGRRELTAITAITAEVIRCTAVVGCVMVLLAQYRGCQPRTRVNVLDRQERYRKSEESSAQAKMLQIGGHVDRLAREKSGETRQEMVGSWPGGRPKSISCWTGGRQAFM